MSNTSGAAASEKREVLTKSFATGELAPIGNRDASSRIEQAKEARQRIALPPE